MAKSAKKRQAEYRAKRKAQGLCAYPGCDRKPRKYALCPGHREDARERARDRTFVAGTYEDALADRDQWRERATKAVEAAKSYRELYEENLDLRFRVETLELDLAEANRRKAGYLPEGIPGSTRLKPGQPVCGSIKWKTEIAHERIDPVYSLNNS